MIATRTTALLSACGPPAALAALTPAEGDLEEIEQDVEEAISIAVANGEFDNLEGHNLHSAFRTSLRASLSFRAVCSTLGAT